MAGMNSNGHKGLKYSEKTKRKMSDSHKGLKHSKETRKKMSKSLKDKKYHLSKETKKKISDIKLKDNWMKGRTGDKSPKWKGGYVPQPYSSDWTDTLRGAIRQRDSYVCQLCGIHQSELEGRNKRLDVHHIDYNRKNCNPSNLITLCRSCHLKTNFNREYWIKLLPKEVE